MALIFAGYDTTAYAIAAVDTGKPIMIARYVWGM